MTLVAVLCGMALAVEPQGLTLDEALRMAEASPFMAAIEADIDVARAEEQQARLLPNPEIEYQGYARTFGTPEAINGQQHQVTVGIPLLLAGQRRFRMRAAKLETATVEAEVCVARKQVERVVALAWVELLAAQEGLETLVEARTALAEAEALTRARAVRGAQSEYDAARVSHELHVLDSGIAVARVEVSDASRGLAAILGRSRWAPRAEGNLDEPTAAIGTAARPELDTLPAVAASRRAERLAEGREALARRGRWPVPVLSAGTYVTTDGDSASVTFGLQVPLPLFDRGQADVARARAVARRARLRTEAIERTASAEQERARARLEDRRAAIVGFHAEVQEVAPRLRSMARTAYAGGISSVLELIDAERTHLDARLRALELTRAHAVAAVELEAVQGTLGSPCP